MCSNEHTNILENFHNSSAYGTLGYCRKGDRFSPIKKKLKKKGKWDKKKIYKF